MHDQIPKCTYLSYSDLRPCRRDSKHLDTKQHRTQHHTRQQPKTTSSDMTAFTPENYNARTSKLHLAQSPEHSTRSNTTFPSGCVSAISSVDFFCCPHHYSGPESLQFWKTASAQSHKGTLLSTELCIKVQYFIKNSH
jgi:hypothetical protein